ncbi:MAG: DUF4065 domain-containing protein [Alistipes sp.]|nr:DUF4065 domain-containing protein [Alistipes sp.]
MSYKVLDVARYIINYSNKEGYGISNLKLQKLLYFVQAEFLAFTEDNQPCFLEEIEAWGFGPVVPEVYQEFKQYGSANIPSVLKYYEVTDDWEVNEKKFDLKLIDIEDRQIINQIVDGFSDYSAAALVTITHQQKPWKDVYEEGMNNIITKKSIREYFERDAS